MKRIWIMVMALACVLFTGCNSLFLGDTTVVLPEQSESAVRSAKTKYNDPAYVDKFQGSGDGAFFFLEGRSMKKEDIIQFECLDYQESEGVFVYAYQTMLDNGSGKMATDMLGYNPETKEGFIFYSNETDASVEPTMFAQKVYLKDDEYQYFIYFGGLGSFFLPDGRSYRAINLKDTYMEVVEKLGNIENVTILSVNVVATDIYENIISANLLAERVTVDENTEWSDEMKESDQITDESGEEGTVSLRIEYKITDLGGTTLTHDLEKKIITMDYLDEPMARKVPEEYLLESKMLLGEVIVDEDSIVKSAILGGFIESVKDIKEERPVKEEEPEDGAEESEAGEGETDETETEEIKTESVLVRREALLTPGSYFCITSSYQSGITRVGFGFDEGIRYNGNKYVIDYGHEITAVFNVKKEEHLSSEIVTAGPGGNGTERVIITKDMVRAITRGGLMDIPLKDLDFSRDVTLDDGAAGETQTGEQSGETQTGEQSEETQAEGQSEETQAEEQSEGTQAEEQSEEIKTDKYEEVYKKDDSQLLDKLDESVVAVGETQNQDSANAGMAENKSYDKEQLVNDGIVAGDVVYNPDVEANSEIYKPYNFLKVGSGLLICSLNSGLLRYFDYNKEVTQVLDCPIFRAWLLPETKELIAVGFDDNSKKYLPSDIPFAKYLRIKIEMGEKSEGDKYRIEKNHLEETQAGDQTEETQDGDQTDETQVEDQSEEAQTGDQSAPNRGES